MTEDRPRRSRRARPRRASVGQAIERQARTPRRDLDAAFRGAGKVFLLTPPNPDQITQARNGIAAARRAGVPLLVRLSAGMVPMMADAPTRVTRQHFAIEAELEASGLTYTILRPHFFMQNLLIAAGRSSASE